ncbi:phosphopentomutase [Reinekea blandensis]|uniref:Phosphopentomutase n=1 Tax=Reinekea blandensis MED297 TaxID=314283 RepID=A4BED4_9GAMM|nr:phosphopentomutase [Reinekea blandensis]EAR09612.1 phosphopentomutase [Reinekea blandensis MED297]
MKRVHIMVLDSFGIGATRDADKFGDVGANTLGHIAQQCARGQADTDREGPLKLPNFTRLGLVNAATESAGGQTPEGLTTTDATIGSYGFAEELSSGKDTPSGHWEIAGVPVLFDWGYFSEKEQSFPQSMLDAFIEKTGVPGILGNCHASGTEIIQRLGEEHMETGKPIVYTSADSVFQIACHEESFGLDRLYELCEVARELVNEYNIGRVIARPFIGDDADTFERTGNRKDLAVEPPSKTVLQKLAEAGGEVISIGKIADIYAHTGITQKYKATGLGPLFDKTLEVIQDAPDRSIVFTNFVDFDSSYGHRRNVPGYAAALEYFDKRVPELLDAVDDDDLVIFTADHGCDPTWPGSDHTREHIPVIVYCKNRESANLGLRNSFADIGQTIADYFGLEAMDYGESFLPTMKPKANAA